MFRLQDEKKKLLVLDDIWREHDWNRIGMPLYDLKNCKILFTTQIILACKSMNCQRKIRLDIFDEDEAWALFKSSANLEDASLKKLAKMVEKECGHLPIALVSVGKALRDKPHQEWDRALRKLQKGEHEEILYRSNESAYRSLKFSFDELPREDTKLCLLLCSLFPEDHEICADSLARYVHGLRLYNTNSSIKDTMMEVLHALQLLKDSHLLLEGEKKGLFKMHDLVRDIVLLLIGKSDSAVRVGSSIDLEERPTDEIKHCRALSLLNYRVEQLPDEMDFLSFEMLLLSRKKRGQEWYYQEEFNIPDRFFRELGKLHVLSLTCGILSLHSLESLANLRCLELRYCYFTSGAAANLNSLRTLKLLEILSFCVSDIGELPDEIRELNHLKVLDLTECYISRIAPNMIQNLSKLEEVYFGPFEDWKAEGEGASVVELNSLKHLAILSIVARGNIPADFVFHHELIGYHLDMCGCLCPTPIFEPKLKHPPVRTIFMRLTDATVRACKELFNNVYRLRIDRNEEGFKNMIPDVSKMGFESLTHPEVFSCVMDCLVNTSKQQQVAMKPFSNLVEINICSTSLREICEGPPQHGFFEKLQSLPVSECGQGV